MAARTTIKVALRTGAAKDDCLSSSMTGLTEDNLVGALDVLANDPGAATLYSLAQGIEQGAGQYPVVTSAVLESGATITIAEDGTLSYDASKFAGLQSLAVGEVELDTFTYTVQMANGALSTATATVEIMGANDRPTLAPVAPLNVLDTSPRVRIVVASIEPRTWGR
jgi:VCBS repeat-containing protein